MTEDLRARISAALRDHQPPTHVDRDGLPPDEFDCCADAVMAVLDEAFPPRQFLDPAPQMRPEDVAAWYVAWAEVLGGDTRMRAAVLPPSGDAAALRRVRGAITALDAQLAHEDTGERHVLEQIRHAIEDVGADG